MSSSDMLDSWITEVNSLGTESAITLIMSGATVTGYLTPTARYLAWLDEISSRATFGERALPRSEIGPISEQQAELARQAWAESARIGQGDGTSENFCLRDVTIMGLGQPTEWLRLPYLVVSRAAVAGFSPILIST
ncbi:MAG: hypothetical protein JSW71_05045 [Gemmatimonadota bacterium]|nr:MAG: hypothetical protein JSW71_05045 [Gemmatimonadota bacterium]